MTDHDLLQQYAKTGSQQAFAELVALHQNWIYSAALRLVRRRDWAQDVTQAVFLLLAQRAKTLKTASLNAWLFKVTRYCSANLLRAERRREKRESGAAMMSNQFQTDGGESKWEELAPILEEAVAQLGHSDMQAVLLRFYQGKSLAEIGAALGVSDNAAGKRVARAVEQLRSTMAGKGVVIPASAVAVSLLTQHVTHAAPPALAALCIPNESGLVARQIAQGVNRMLFLMKLKWAAACVLVLGLIPAAISMVLSAPGNPPPLPAPANAPVAAKAPATVPSGGISDDLAITPFFNSETVAVISLKVADLDVDTLADRESQIILDTLPQDDPRRALVDQQMVKVRENFKVVMDATKSAGCDHFYTIGSENGDRGPAGFFALPINPETTDFVAMDRLMKKRGVNTSDGKARVYFDGTPRVTGDQDAILNKLLSDDPRPDLLSALTDGPDAPARVVIFRCPEILSKSGFAHVLGLGNCAEPEWTHVKWCRISGSASPAASAIVSLQMDGDSAATAMGNLLRAKFAAVGVTAVADPMDQAVAKLVAALKPEVSGDRVSLQFDQATVEPVVADWYLHILNAPARGK